MSLSTTYSLLQPQFHYFRKMYIHSTRVLNRFINTLTTLSRSPGASIAAASANAAEAKAIYRLLQNPELNEENVMDCYRHETLRQMQQTGETVFLCVQDTTGISYVKHEKTVGLGEHNDKNSKGLLAHTALLMTTSGLPLGLLHQQIWARFPQPKQRKVSRPYEEKENYKWTEAARASAAAVPANIKLVHIGDREADFFEFLHQLQEEGQSYVVRSVQNRITDVEGARLWDKTRSQPAAGEIRVSIPRDTRRNVAARETTLSVRFASDTVKVPDHLQQKNAGYQPLSCTLIHVREETTPEGLEPIEWYLITNMVIADMEEAAEKVAWYVQRWKIERFHYILKSGCEVEKLQERHADRLKKLILFYSIIAVQIQQLTYLARQQPDTSCTDVMSDEEWKVLYRIAHKTNILPAQPPTLNEAVLALAKLGGFLGRKSDGDPGAKVLWKGLQAFRTVFESYRYLM